MLVGTVDHGNEEDMAVATEEDIEIPTVTIMATTITDTITMGTIRDIILIIIITRHLVSYF